MQRNTAIIIAIITLVIGAGIGYATGANNAPKIQEAPMAGHMMPDGSMMGGNTQSMSMENMMASMNAELKDKTGDEFDKAFITEMIMHHQGAVEMAQLALKNAKHDEIKTLANAIITAQNKEIAEMKSWQEAWYEIR